MNAGRGAGKITAGMLAFWALGEHLRSMTPRQRRAFGIVAHLKSFKKQRREKSRQVMNLWLHVGRELRQRRGARPSEDHRRRFPFLRS